MAQTPGLIPNPGLILTMPTANISLRVGYTPSGSVSFSVRTHAAPTLPETNEVHLSAETADELAGWLDTDEVHEGQREYPLAAGTLTARKRMHSMTGEELVEISISLGEGVGNMIVLTYPQTRALVAYLQH